MVKSDTRTARSRITELSNLQFAVVLTLPVIIFLVTMIVYPLGYSIWLSVHKVSFFGGYRATFIGLDNYLHALQSPNFWNGVVLSLRFTVESVILTILIGLGIALTLSREFRGRQLVRVVAILPWAVSTYAAGVMLGYLWRGRMGILTAISYALGFETVISPLDAAPMEMLAVGNAWILAPLVAFFLLASIETIPSRLYHLAEIDRLNSIQKFTHVTLPYLRYTLFVFTSIIAVLSLKVFDYIFVQTGGGPGISTSTLTYEIYKESFKSLNLGYGAALSFYLLLIILVFTTLLFVVWGRREI
jgi:multiple sugar transport system permease protein